MVSLISLTDRMISFGSKIRPVWLKERLFSFVLTPAVIQASVQQDIENQLEPVEEVYGYDESAIDETTFARTIAQIIEVVLGFLGVIFIVLIVYAGFLWMTSAGNEEKIATAKKIMISAVIGTAIVLAAYAITYFVVDKLLEATGVNNTGLD